MVKASYSSARRARLSAYIITGRWRDVQGEQPPSLPRVRPSGARQPGRSRADRPARPRRSPALCQPWVASSTLLLKREASSEAGLDLAVTLLRLGRQTDAGEAEIAQGVQDLLALGIIQPGKSSLSERAR